MPKKKIQTSNAPTPLGPYSQAIKVDKIIYLSGQVPLDPKTGEIVSADFKTQTLQVFKNLEAMLQAAGGNLNNLVKVNAYLTNLDQFAIFNEVMADLISEPYPARAAIEISKLPKGALLEVDGTAILD